MHSLPEKSEEMACPTSLPNTSLVTTNAIMKTVVYQKNFLGGFRKFQQISGISKSCRHPVIMVLDGQWGHQLQMRRQKLFVIVIKCVDNW